MAEPEDDIQMSLVDHLEEMRWRIFRCLGAIAILFPIAYFFAPEIIRWFRVVICREYISEFLAMKPMEPFLARVKVSFFLSLVGAIPIIAHQLWGFIAPGLFHKEQYYLKRFVFFSTGLFLTGAAFALFAIYPLVLDFNLNMEMDITYKPSLNHALGLAVMMMVGFGLMFQLPIVVFALARTGIVPVEKLAAVRPYVYVGILVLSAVLTPPDVISQLALGVPSFLLFEISLILARIGNKKDPVAPADQPDDEDTDDTNGGPPPPDDDGGDSPDEPDDDLEEPEDYNYDYDDEYAEYRREQKAKSHLNRRKRSGAGQKSLHKLIQQHSMRNRHRRR